MRFFANCSFLVKIEKKTSSRRHNFMCAPKTPNFQKLVQNRIFGKFYPYPRTEIRQIAKNVQVLRKQMQEKIVTQWRINAHLVVLL